MMAEGTRATRSRAGIASCLVLALAGCTATPSGPTEPKAIARSVLALLASRGLSVCVDRDAGGDSLALYRQMMAAPAAARAHLRWFPPLPFRPEQRVTLAKLRSLGVPRSDARLVEPERQDDPLPQASQAALDAAAARLSGHRPQPVRIDASWTPPGVTARWWLANDLTRSCWPQFRMSAPVYARDIAFVAVRADHWGVLYALTPDGKAWKVRAEWSRWLY